MERDPTKGEFHAKLIETKKRAIGLIFPPRSHGYKTTAEHQLFMLMAGRPSAADAWILQIRKLSIQLQ